MVMRNDNCKKTTKQLLPSMGGRAASWVPNPFGQACLAGATSLPLSDVFKVLMDRNESVYFKKDEIVTICGIPAASRAYYFNQGEVPESSFFLNGWEYLTVYEIIGSEAYLPKGGASC
jgi:hypothetical protein